MDELASWFEIELKRVLAETEPVEYNDHWMKPRQEDVWVVNGEPCF